MSEITRQYIAQRISHLKQLAREKREKDAKAAAVNQTIPLEIIAKEIFNPEEKIVNLAGEELPF